MSERCEHCRYPRRARERPEQAEDEPCNGYGCDEGDGYEDDCRQDWADCFSSSGAIDLHWLLPLYPNTPENGICPPFERASEPVKASPEIAAVHPAPIVRLAGVAPAVIVVTVIAGEQV